MARAIEIPHIHSRLTSARLTCDLRNRRRRCMSGAGAVSRSAGAVPPRAGTV
jgi:hypothetical protein